MASIIANGRRKGDDGFEYIKDADTLRCPMGELAKYKYHKKAEIGKREGIRGKFLI